MNAIPEEDGMTTLDVREEIRSGGDPFGLIIGTAARLPEAGRLRLITPFEPRPLFRVMALQGWAHRCREIDGGIWETVFFRESTVAPAPLEWVRADLCGLPTAEVEAAILDRMVTLQPGQALAVTTMETPECIRGQVVELGWTMQIRSGQSGAWVTEIIPS
ncbi:MAG: DUF2249 domain-containing protein [Verrucomicrobiales bacterium]|nr:DUF2249 domain-containing protein [Verrucomicrobiales bacterium]